MDEGNDRYLHTDQGASKMSNINKSSVNLMA